MNRKPTKAEFKTFWSVFEAQQQRKKQSPLLEDLEALDQTIHEAKTIPPEKFNTDKGQP